MCIELIITIPRQRPQRKQIDARRNRLPLPQRLFDFILELPWQRRRMLSQELENIVADKILVATVRDAEDIGYANGVELDGEGVVGYDNVLEIVSYLPAGWRKWQEDIAYL